MKIEQVWQQYQVSLKRFLLAKTNNEADAQDLLQEILIKSHNNLHTMQDPSKVKAWLFQVANHTLIDFYRKNNRSKYTAAELMTFPTDEVSAIDALSECVQPFIQALPEADAQLLQAIDIENKSQKLYAQELGVSYSTLKSRVQKSRRSLKQLFQQCCTFSLDRQGNLYEFEKK